MRDQRSASAPAGISPANVTTDQIANSDEIAPVVSPASANSSA
nr:hypothetical protein [Actinoplanes palleronii]